MAADARYTVFTVMLYIAIVGLAFQDPEYRTGDIPKEELARLVKQLQDEKTLTLVSPKPMRKESTTD